MKFNRPMSRIMVVVVAGSLALLFAGYQDSAEVQRLSALNDFRVLQDIDASPENCRDFFGLEPGRECERLRKREVAAAQSWIEDSRSVYPLAHVQQNPLGMLGVVAGHFASLLGALTVAILVSAHTAGEWTHGTYKPVLARYGRGPRFVLTKLIATWVTTVLLMLAVYLVLLALSPLHRVVYADIHPSPKTFSAWAYSWPLFAKSLITLMFFVSIAVLCALLTRNAMGTLGLTLAVLFVFLISGALASFSHSSPAFWISRLMDFRQSGMFGDHLWIDQFAAGTTGASGLPATGTVAVWLALTCIGAITVSSWRLASSDA